MKAMQICWSYVETLAAVIAHSQIRIVELPKNLPAGYDDVDVTILEWIAADSRGAERKLVQM